MKGSATPPASDPRVAQMFSQGAALHRAGKLAEAEHLYRNVLQIQPNHIAALNLLAAICIQRGQHEDVARLLDRSAHLDPRQVDVLIELGNAQYTLGRHGDALSSYETALSLRPDDADAWVGRGAAQQAAGQHAAALASYDRAIDLRPDHAEAMVNRGVALQTMGRYAEAYASFTRALAIRPDFGEAYANRAVLLNQQRRYGEALADHERSVLLAPTDANVYYNRGNTLRECRRFDEAVVAYDKAIAFDPGHASAYYNRGLTLQAMDRYAEAIVGFETLVTIAPRHPYVRGNLLHARTCVGDWKGWEEEVAEICKLIEQDFPASQPFPLLAVPASAAVLKKSAICYVADKYPIPPLQLWKGERYRHDRIRIGYFSADFHGHATAFLAAELFERHDRSAFEVFAFSFGPDRHDPMRERLTRAFDHFHDVRSQSDLAIASMVRELEIDIAIDLKGLTENCRPGIFALRPAPVQVNYLGFPGTMGAPYIDYIIGDPVVTPAQEAEHFSENIVQLPHCYQVNDTQRRIAATTVSRAEAGLPGTGFVFCCFNNNFKVTPDVFAIWMRLLTQVNGSVLWLLEGNPAVKERLLHEAKDRGIAPERIVFAPRIEPADHLARHGHADLFLDTFYYNAHTTASDALWAGVPVLTRMGETFASRVAASLLQAVGLPELIARTAGEYEAKAVEIATRPDLLREIRSKLGRNRLTQPLFDSRRFARNIEAGYRAMWRRCQEGLEPAPIIIQEEERQ